MEGSVVVVSPVTIGSSLGVMDTSELSVVLEVTVALIAVGLSLSSLDVNSVAIGWVSWSQLARLIEVLGLLL